MTRLFTTLAALLLLHSAQAQITIDASDMPVHADTLRFSNANAMDMSAWAADSGANKVWNYILVPTSQGLDEYKYPAEVSPSLTSSPFGTSITATYCYGPKVADSIPGIGLVASGITIEDLHTYYNIFVTPSSYVAEAFSAKISILPVGADYIQPDVLYHFPMTYGSSGTANFHLKFGSPLVGGIEQKGTRTWRVDGWGAITTPYFFTPTPCIRVRSEIAEIDSVSFSGNTFGIERTTIEYKWLVKGEHQPALQLTAIRVADTEIVTTVRYKDRYRAEFATSVSETAGTATQVSAWPNPTTNGHVHINVPAHWKQYFVEIFDVNGKSVLSLNNTADADLSALPSGTYIARVVSGAAYAYVQLTKR